MTTDVHLISFSPCGGTEKVMQALGRDITMPKHERNITLRKSRLGSLNFTENDLVFLGFPVYGGHMPRFFPELVSSLHGNNTPLAMVAVYGNREYEGAFLDMHEGVLANGFNPVAAIAAIAQHSSAPHVATGRPDADDQEKLANFGLQTLNKAQTGNQAIAAPGTHRMWNLPAGMDVFPNTRMGGCTNCGDCVDVCPMGAIPAEEPSITINDKCIVCAACIKYCPAKARQFGGAEAKKEYASHLANAVVRKEAVIFV